MSPLETRYRAALRWYPRSWRVKNEDVVVGTLLDVAHSESRTRPRLRELANLGAHGLAERVRMVPSVVPPALRDRTATAALAVGAAIALSAIMQLETTPSRAVLWFGNGYATFGPFASPMIVVYLAWIVALLAATAGLASVARGIALATVPMTIAARLVADATEMFLRPTSTFLGILILLALLVAVGAPAPGRIGVRWLLIWFLPALVVFTLPQTLGSPGGYAFQSPIWLDRPTVLAWSAVIVVAIALAAHLVGLRGWSATVLLIGLPFVAASLLGVSSMITELAGWLTLISFAAVLVVVLLRVLGFRLQLQRAVPLAVPINESGTRQPGGRRG